MGVALNFLVKIFWDDCNACVKMNISYLLERWNFRIGNENM